MAYQISDYVGGDFEDKVGDAVDAAFVPIAAVVFGLILLVAVLKKK